MTFRFYITLITVQNFLSQFFTWVKTRFSIGSLFSFTLFLLAAKHLGTLIRKALFNEQERANFEPLKISRTFVLSIHTLSTSFMCVNCDVIPHTVDLVIYVQFLAAMVMWSLTLLKKPRNSFRRVIWRSEDGKFLLTMHLAKSKVSYLYYCEHF